ncbi:hypothetical protein EOS_16875 [Caballeronia mineralivorans PML1(12)]|uniref:Uncharacterized protein n=1 Tax=Caballeronia mineralivorans PML1(12) TaxID=908627 RepID=A0A0J1CWM0_9BURK|nr:hypothetical protein EOS_16875 [Caballeronia mineralivorans PML1(12)]
MIHARRHFFSMLTNATLHAGSAQNGQTAVDIRFFFGRTLVVLIYDRLNAAIANIKLSERLCWGSPQVMLRH